MSSAPDALPHCGQCHPGVPNLATRLDETVWWCPGCGRMWTPEMNADWAPPIDDAGELVVGVALDDWEVSLLYRVCERYAREREAAGVPELERLAILREKLADALVRLRAVQDALRRQAEP